MSLEPNPYTPPRSIETTLPPPPPKKPLKEFFALVAFQLFITTVLAPADAGRWHRYITVYLVIFDIVVYFGFVSGGRSRLDSGSLGTLVFIVGSFVIAIFGTYFTDVLDLP